MSYGSGWGSSPWGGDSPLVQSNPVFYDVAVEDSISMLDVVSIGTYDILVSDTISITSTISVNLKDVVVSDTIAITTDTNTGIFDVGVNDSIVLTADIFVGLAQIPAFFVAAQSPTKVEVVFSVTMSVDSNFLSAASYTITQVEGSIQIPVLSAVASGPLPIRRVTLEVGVPLESKRYYFLTVGTTVISLTGDSSSPDYARFQWKDQTAPVFIAPLEIPIRDFSGEIHEGILGQPDGLVFFSPALEDVSSTSTIELEQLSVCTRAYDSYEMPNPPDPTPLFTWGPGITAVVGSTSVLWAPHDRLGLPMMNLQYDVKDKFEPAYDLNLSAVLVETIDITKGGFLNDPRWKTFPATSATVFTTAANQTSIGPGPTTSVNLDWPKIYLGDSFPMTDQIILNVLDLEIHDSVTVTESTVRTLL
jgi:hypothetical protein